MAIISCNNLSVSYGETNVINNLTFSVQPGEYLCIVGENGTGKSSLVKALLGLIKHNGSIVFGDGLQQTDIGYLPQQTDIQKGFPANVYEIVLSGRLNKRGRHPFYSSEDKRIAVECMKKLDAYGLINRNYRELSGGQQQRVLLARALCSAGKLLLLDEPTAGLDPIVSEEMYSLINNINKKENIAIIMVTHDIANAVRYSDSILLLEHGSHEICTPNELCNKYSELVNKR